MKENERKINICAALNVPLDTFASAPDVGKEAE